MSAPALAPVSIYDTTLRDGTQGEGVSFTVASKLRVAEKLDAAGVDYIEGGWPGSNPRDQQFFAEARHLRLRHAKLAAFGSTCRMGLAAADDAQLRLLLEAETPVVTIFGKTWLLHVTEVLRTTPEENLRMIRDSVAFLRAAGREVIYDAEHFFDGYADNPDYALATLAAAQAGGAQWLVLCDTNGGNLAPRAGEVVGTVVRRFPGQPIGIHAHNDIGLGVAVSLAAVEAGATQVQGTINGHGERIGNANLTAIVPTLSLKMGRTTNCAARLGGWRDLSLFVDEMANLRPDPKQPYTGASAFAHKGGVHANAAAKVARSYEHIDPALVGNRQRVLVSDMAGRASLVLKAREVGVELPADDTRLKPLLEELKRREHAGYEYEAADASFRLLATDTLAEAKVAEPFHLVGYRVMVERDAHGIVSEATVKVQVNGVEHHTVAEAHGPVAALDHALRKALAAAYPALAAVSLSDFKVRILEGREGAESRVRVLIETTDGQRRWGTVGASDNIIEASYQALRDALVHALRFPTPPTAAQG